MNATHHDNEPTANLVAAALTAQDDEMRRRYIWRLQQRGDTEVFAAACILCASTEPRERLAGVDILAQGQVKEKSSHYCENCNKMMQVG